MLWSGQQCEQGALQRQVQGKDVSLRAPRIRCRNAQDDRYMTPYAISIDHWSLCIVHCISEGM